MTVSVLICDDSKLARKQMARSIPDAWDVDIEFAEHGEQAVSMLKDGNFQVMFLDLNMPVMDGYQTMAEINSQGIDIKVIVVSGDVQEEARRRMLELGALEFIRKPVDNNKLIEILYEYDLYSGEKDAGNRITESVPVDKLDAYREMANVAMGRAGEKLADLLGRFINLPIPNVNEIASTELHMAVAEIKRNQGVSAVSQGFVAHGINGEAIVLFNDSDMSNMVELLEYDNLESSHSLEIEALMDVSNILIGACLLAFSDQLHVKFMQNHPILLGRHMDFDQLLNNTVSRWNQVVAIEIGYSIEGRDIDFDLLFLFPSDAMEMVYSRLVGEMNE